jgi:hypothetical protein
MANPKWIDASVIAGSVMFCLALAVSAIFLPQWRVLHVAQAAPYLVVIVLARRMSPWGFGAGVIMACFWNALLLFRSPVGEALIRGDVARPDVALQLFGALGHFLMIIGCLVGLLRTRPAGQQWAKFFAGGVIAVGYLLVMVWTVGPPEAVEHIRQALGF